MISSIITVLSQVLHLLSAPRDYFEFSFFIMVLPVAMPLVVRGGFLESTEGDLKYCLPVGGELFAEDLL